MDAQQLHVDAYRAELLAQQRVVAERPPRAGSGAVTAGSCAVTAGSCAGTAGRSAATALRLPHELDHQLQMTLEGRERAGARAALFLEQAVDHLPAVVDAADHVCLRHAHLV